MRKLAFVPYTPFKIDDKVEYNGEQGITKRLSNERLSAISGAGAGAILGGLAGITAGLALHKLSPGRYGMRTKRFHEMQRRSGFNPVSGYLKNYAKIHGAEPIKVPPSVYMPIMFPIIGAGAGTIAAQYKARRRMGEWVGETDITPAKYMHREVAPVLGGMIAGIAAGGIIDKAIQSTNSSDVVKKLLPAAGIVGASLAVEEIVSRKIIEHQAKKHMAGDRLNNGAAILVSAMGKKKNND